MQYSIPTTIPKHVFRAYDVRGIVDEELTPDVFYAVGLATGTIAQRQGQKQFILGQDARLSSPALADALKAGILASGCDVLDIGIVPSPLVYFAIFHLAVPSGVMVTGSHNPSNYNGVKIVIDHKTLSGEEIAAIYDTIKQQDFSQGSGEYFQTDVIADYINRIEGDVKLERPLKIVIDCGNGVAGKVAPDLFRRLGCECIELYCDVDGRFPNHHPDPSVPENLHDIAEAVRKHHADIGLAFDGDADRLGMVTNAGEIVWPDRLMMLYSQHILAQTHTGNIVFDVKCSAHLRRIIKQHGGTPIMCQTGHSLVKGTMRKTQALIAGEMSGHLFFQHRWYGFDDGLYAGARLLEIVSQQSESVTELFSQFPNSPVTPEIKIAIDEDKKFAFMEQFAKQATFNDAEVITIDGIRVEFRDGWGLVRASNTSPNLTIRFEADDETAMQRIQHVFREQIQAIDPLLAF